MSVLLIRGMEMPSKYPVCLVVWPDGRTVKYVVANVDSAKTGECQAVPVPEHGRLIDAAALWVEINKICDRRDEGIISDLTCLQQLLSAVRHAPTIIPAEPLNEEVEE